MASAGTVLVAGADGGIGGACVHRLRTAGREVVGVDRPTDVSQPWGAARAVADAADAAGPDGTLAGVVHAVGMSGRRLGDGPVADCTDEAWTEVLRVNLDSAFLLLRAALPRLAPGGAVVVVGSVLARHTDPDFLTAAYAASKSGLEGLVRVAAREAAGRDVRVNCVAAGLTDTPMSARAAADERVASRLPELQPLGGRMVEPDEVAAAVAWLLSDDAAAVTGCCLPVDRGWSLR